MVWFQSAVKQCWEWQCVRESQYSVTTRGLSYLHLMSDCAVCPSFIMHLWKITAAFATWPSTLPWFAIPCDHLALILYIFHWSIHKPLCVFCSCKKYVRTDHLCHKRCQSCSKRKKTEKLNIVTLLSQNLWYGWLFLYTKDHKQSHVVFMSPTFIEFLLKNS